MSKLLTALILALSLCVAPALAQSDTDTDAAVDQVLGDHATYHAAFDAIQKAVAGNDKAAFAGWVSYPIDVTIEGKQVTIEDAQQFADRYDAIVTDDIKAAITGQKWSDVLVNDEGLMFGDGEAWLNGICKDDACDQFDVKIITIQPPST